LRDVAILTHGQVIEALAANRLTSPAPLLRVEDWAKACAVEEVLGVVAETLNDDRIGCCLDAVAPHLDAMVGSVGARAISDFGIDVSRLDWAMTSISLAGDYPDPEAGLVLPSYGKPKDRRVDRKQVQTGIAAARDGGIPLFDRAFDGRAGEVNQVVGAMEALRKMAGGRSFLLACDAKLVSYKNLAAMVDAEVTFVAPASKSYASGEVLADRDITRAIDAGYVPERSSRTVRSAEPVSYRVYEDTMVVAGLRKADPVVDVRRVFVWSSGNAGAAVTNRARKLDRAAGELGRVQVGMGGRFYNTAAKVAAIGADQRVFPYLISEISADEAGRPTLAWHWDQDALDAEAASDGWYALLTNLGAGTADPAEVLQRYKGQEVVRRRYGDFKGPLAVAPCSSTTTGASRPSSP